MMVATAVEAPTFMGPSARPPRTAGTPPDEGPGCPGDPRLVSGGETEPRYAGGSGSITGGTKVYPRCQSPPSAGPYQSSSVTDDRSNITRRQPSSSSRCIPSTAASPSVIPANRGIVSTRYRCAFTSVRASVAIAPLQKVPSPAPPAADGYRPFG